MTTCHIIFFCVISAFTYGTIHYISSEEGDDLLNNKADQSLTVGDCGVTSRLSEQSKNEMINKFNDFRSSVDSSAMSFMRWDSRIARIAQQQVDKCDLRFKMPQSCINAYFWSASGIEGSSDGVTLPEINTPKYLTSLFDGIMNYNPETNECYEGSCYFVKKMLRDNFARFACASSKCKVMTFKDGSTMKGAIINICYLIYGNGYHHVPTEYTKPFSTNGKACEKCSDLTQSGYNCNKGLCDICNGNGCVCKKTKKCSANAVFNRSFCKCECKKGFFGDNCEYPCKCKDVRGNCAMLKLRGYCTKQPNKMRQICSGTCKNVCESIKPEEGLASCK